jgi:hypothetical protein
MILILLEALGALLILVLIVWWTMFSGRRKGELRSDSDNAPSNASRHTPGAASPPERHQDDDAPPPPR